jgi:manganese transport protein
VPAALTIYFAGEESSLGLLLLSQAVLSLQLPFAIIPLIQFTSDKNRMGSFANRGWVKVLAWISATIIVGLNAMLAKQTIGGWIEASGRWRPLVIGVTMPLSIGLLGLLGYIVFGPRVRRAAVVLPDTAGVGSGDAPVYHRILLPLDHTALDRLALSHGAAMAKLHGATLYLLHVEEGVTSQIYGKEASTAEVEAGEQYLGRIAQTLRDQGIQVETAVSHSSSPKREIVRYAREIRPDLVIMGAHGHGGLKDLIFGNTINPVRHHLELPMLIVRPGKS